MKTRKHFAKRFTALILCAIMAVGAASGCNSNKLSAVGRYMENELEISVNRILSVNFLQNSLIYYGDTQNGIVRCQLSDASASGGAVIGWLQRLTADGGRLIGLSEGEDGTLYALFMDADNKYQLACSGDGTDYQLLYVPELAAIDMGGGGVFQISGGPVSGGPGGGPTTSGAGGGPSFSSPASETGLGGDDASRGAAMVGDGGERPISVGVIGGGPISGSSMGGGPSTGMPMGMPMMPNGVIALYDGFLLLMGDAIYHYRLDGTLARKYDEIGYANLVGVYSNIMAVGNVNRREISLYDISTGTKTETVKYDDMDSQTFVGYDKIGLFAGSADGIFRWEEKDGKWKRLLDGGLTSLIIPGNNITQMVGDGQGGFYALLGMNEPKLMRYIYDESIASEPETILEVFSLYDSNTLRLAIGEFQRANPNIGIKLNVALGSGSSATAEDVIRALNTEIIAGKGPDIILLDGMPVESYIEKGVLRDITELVNRLASENLIMANLTNAYKKSGKIFGLPARFTLPLMMGETDLLNMFNSLSDIVAAVGADPTRDPAILRAPDNLWDEGGIFMQYYESCAAGFTNADGSLDEAKLAQYFRDMMALQQLLLDNTDAPRGRMMAMATVGGSGFERIDMGSQDLKNGKASTHLMVLSGVLSLGVIARDLGNRADMSLQSMFGDNAYYTGCGVGISSASKNQAAAESFLAFLVSDTVQDKYVYDGFPVNRGALTRMVDERIKDLDSPSDMGFYDLCDSLETALFVDAVVKVAVEAQVRGLLSGALTPEQAAARVVDSTKLYLAE